MIWFTLILFMERIIVAVVWGTDYMEHMSEEEFEKIEFQCGPLNCDHPNVVKIYNRWLNTDFGCTKCGLCSTNRYVFQRKEGNGNNI